MLADVTVVASMQAELSHPIVPAASTVMRGHGHRTWSGRTFSEVVKMRSQGVYIIALPHCHETESKQIA